MYQSVLNSFSCLSLEGNNLSSITHRPLLPTDCIVAYPIPEHIP